MKDEITRHGKENIICIIEHEITLYQFKETASSTTSYKLSDRVLEMEYMEIKSLILYKIIYK